MDVTTFDNYSAYLDAITQPNSLDWKGAQNQGITSDQFAALDIAKYMQSKIDQQATQAAQTRIRQKSQVALANLKDVIAPSKQPLPPTPTPVV